MNNQSNHILYIDDENENLIGFKYALRKYYKVHIASSASEGFEILAQHPIKVIVSDQRMPKITGVQMFERTAVEYPNVFRIILTAYADVQDIIQAINKGKIFQYVRKPWDKEELKMVIDNAIRLFDLNEQNKKLTIDLLHKNKELESINNNLENTVKERTSKIEDQKTELEKHKNHLKELVKERTLALEKAKNRAEESDRLKSSFLANVSHELRTPMNAIVGFTELLFAYECSREEKEVFKNNIYTNTETLLRLIDDILDISLIEAGQLKIIMGNHDLNLFMNEIFASLNEQKLGTGKENIDIKLTIPDETVEIHTDKTRLQQILSNLLNNALKFTNQGNIEFGYQHSYSDGQQYLLFFVKDTGIGIPEEAAQYVFERFRKVEDSNEMLYRGSGLGLSISKNLVEKLHGEIWFESVPKPGSGTNFYFRLPINNSDQKTEDKENRSAFNHLTRINEDFNGVTILIAEDDESTFEYLKRLLQPTKALLFHAKNGLEVLSLMETHKNIDIILMDIQMPLMDGKEALSKLQNKHNLPVIAQTAYCFSNQELLEEGFTDVVTKPYKPEEILSKIKTHLRKVE